MFNEKRKWADNKIFSFVKFICKIVNSSSNNGDATIFDLCLQKSFFFK